MTVVPVILCGGSGTRLWPLSRRNLAKHHIGIMDGESPYQRTLRRLAASRTFGKPIVIAGQEGRFLASDQAEAVGVAIELVLEPMARDTLPAVTLGALLVARRDPRAVAFVLPSDHLIPDPCAFGDAAALAAEAAEDGDFVVLGLAPTRPASGYGYIRPGETLATGARRVGAFVEKPDIRRAAAPDRRGLPVECRDVLLSRRRGARRDREPCAGHPHCGRVGARRGAGGSRRTPARQELCEGREGELRLCGDGAYEAGGGGPRGLRLVRHRRLARGLGAVSEGRERRRRRGADGADRRREQLYPCRQAAGRGDRRQGPRGRRYPGRPPHQPHRPHPGGEVDGRPTSRPRDGPRPIRRPRCAGRGGGTRPWISATASG